MVETITIDGELISEDEIAALLEPFEEPYDSAELQALIDASSRNASRELAELLAALVVLSLLGTPPRNRLVYSNRDRQYYRGRTPISTAEIRRRMNFEQQQNGTRIRRRTEALIDGQISFEEWQLATVQDIIQGHFRMTLAGVGTPRNITARHLQKLREELKKELGFFIDFASAILGGLLSGAMMLYRSQRYGQSTGVSYGQAEQISHEDGRWVARRFLDPTANHCPSCPAHEQSDWVPASEVVPVGEACECRGRCRCRVEYRLVRLSDRLL